MTGSTAADQKSICRICGCARVQYIHAKEMMFGTQDFFNYFECLDCGCVQIEKYPVDLYKYYSQDYYSFSKESLTGKISLIDSATRQIKRRAIRVRWLRSYWLRRQGNRRWMTEHLGLPIYLALRDHPDARILDVGCGSGQLLRQLRGFGYHAAQGIDPFIDTDVIFHHETLVRKAVLAEITGSFDYVFFHHSLEHMPNQAEVLEHARRLLAPGGVLLIRIPVVGGEAWRRYREHWVQLDPPRHYYLHSLTSLARLADQCGLQLNSVSYDSSGFQFWGSELYRRDIPLLDPRSPARPGPSVFSPEQLAGYEADARRLNATQRGDQIVAILGLKPA